MKTIMKTLNKKITEVENQLINDYKRTFKSIKKSDWGGHNCEFCFKRLDHDVLHVVDSRNDKYCPDCANKILDNQISKLQSFKKKLCNESILDELEEDDDASNN